jgi:hypothetical protein
MVRATAVCIAFVASGLLPVSPAVAANPRAQRSVAGVRATLRQYGADVLAGNGTGACALLTPPARSQIAEANHASSCAAVIKVAAVILKADPTQTAAVLRYPRTVRVTLKGDSASVPKFEASGHATLTYTHGLWYLT